jgi:hypothetical protein
VVEGFLSSFRLLVIAKKKNLPPIGSSAFVQKGEGKVRIISLALVEIFFGSLTQAKGNVTLLH